ncbi:MAG: polysaccharide deacetylase family protein [Promethearchaeota archaeon]
MESWSCSDFFESQRDIIAEAETIEEPLEWILNALKKYEVSITFFFVAQFAEVKPDLIKMVIENGHEIASHGYSHISLTNTDASRSLFELQHSKHVLEKITRLKVLGYRSPSAKSNENLLLVEKAGYKYDSSLVRSIPIPNWYGDLRMDSYPFKLNKLPAYKRVSSDIIEFPISSNPTIKLPMSAWWIRNLGFTYFVKSVASSLKKYNYCAFYMHPWEFSSKFPSIKVPFHVKRNIGAHMKKSLLYVLEKWGKSGYIMTYQDALKSVLDN